MENWFSVDGKSRFLIVNHDSSIGVDSQKVAHVALFRFTVGALFAFSGENREDMISGLKLSHSFPDTLHNPVHVSSIDQIFYPITKPFRFNTRIKHTLQLHVLKFGETRDSDPEKFIGR